MGRADHPPELKKTGGTHPTGMLSCVMFRCCGYQTDSATLLSCFVAVAVPSGFRNTPNPHQSMQQKSRLDGLGRYFETIHQIKLFTSDVVSTGPLVRDHLI